MVADEWLTIVQARDELERQYGVQRSRQAVQRACRLGQIPCEKPGIEYLIRRSDLPAIAEHFRTTGY